MGVCSSMHSTIKTAPAKPGGQNGADAKNNKDQKRHHHRHHHRRRRSLESNESGLRMKPFDNSDHIQAELLKLTKDEIAMLFESFETIIKHRETIAHDIQSRIKDKIPGAVAKLPSNNQKKDILNKTPTAIVMLSGVERCLLRTNDLDRLEEFIKRIVIKHATQYGVSKDMLLSALDITSAILLKHIGISHIPKSERKKDEPLPKHIWQNCVSCSAWARFLEVLHKALDAVVVDPPPSDDAAAPPAPAEPPPAPPAGGPTVTNPPLNSAPTVVIDPPPVAAPPTLSHDKTFGVT